MTQSVNEVAKDLKLMAATEEDAEKKALLMRAADRMVWEHERHMALQKLVFISSNPDQVK